MAKKTRSVTSRSSMKSSEFEPDYTYIKKDLVRIGTMAAGFFVVLIVASFFLN